ncbi:hypothetical protein VNPA110517_03250 [Pseudomonas aeruginosa]|nr:hypothetical protein VNPA110517_03250 [Pseudomonas aeruginosa]
MALLGDCRENLARGATGTGGEKDAPARQAWRGHLVPYAGCCGPREAEPDASPIRFNGIRNYPISAPRIGHPDKNPGSLINTGGIRQRENAPPDRQSWSSPAPSRQGRRRFPHVRRHIDPDWLFDQLPRRCLDRYR